MDLMHIWSLQGAAGTKRVTQLSPWIGYGKSYKHQGPGRMPAGDPTTTGAWMQAEDPAMAAYIVPSVHIRTTRHLCFSGCPWLRATYLLLGKITSSMGHPEAALPFQVSPLIHGSQDKIVQDEASRPKAGGLAAVLWCCLVHVRHRLSHWMLMARMEACSLPCP